jgi:hypothetical protein
METRTGERNPLEASALDLPQEPERAYQGVWVTTALDRRRARCEVSG